MHDHPLAVMMFAAGFGTRMKELTKDQPKPMIPVAGRPLVDHALDLAREINADPIVANLHYKPEVLERHLKAHGVLTIRETPTILETGGGLRNALPLLGEGPVITLNTDAIWSGPNPLALLRDAWEPDRMDALLIAVPIDHADGYDGSGDFTIAKDGTLCRGPGVIYGGAQIIKTNLLNTIADDSFSLNVLWNLMADAGKLHGLRYPGRWCDVGHPDGIRLAEAMLANARV